MKCQKICGNTGPYNQLTDRKYSSMKEFVLLSVVAFVTLVAFSSIASAKMVDVVHLKNGSIIQGMVTEIIPSETAKIETDDGSVFVYQFDEIQSITKKTEPIGKVTTSNGLTKRYLPYAVGLGCGSGCLSSYLPIPILGLGQVYNGEYTKALIFLGLGQLQDMTLCDNMLNMITTQCGVLNCMVGR